MNPAPNIPHFPCLPCLDIYYCYNIGTEGRDQREGAEKLFQSVVSLLCPAKLPLVVQYLFLKSVVYVFSLFTKTVVVVKHFSLLLCLLVLCLSGSLIFLGPELCLSLQ